MANVLIISAVFPPEPVVSAKLSFDIANKLSKTINATVVTPLPSRPHGFQFTQKETFNFKHIQLSSFICSSSNLIGRLRESYSFGKHCYRYISNNYTNIDVIYANTWPLLSQHFTVRAALKYKIPIIIHVQDIYPESLTTKLPILGKMFNWLLLPIDEYTLINATKIIAISDKMKRYLEKTRKLDCEKIQVIPNWQNEDEFIKFKQFKQKSNNSNHFTLMYLGNIGPVAGVDLLIDGFVKAKLNNCRLVIAGSGSQKDFLEKRCKEQQLTNIEFWDVPDGKVPEIQDYADVMLLSIKKGAASSSIPSKLPAYMFSAKPIITCVDANSDTANAIIEADCGWVLEPENSNELANKMVEVFSSKKDVLTNKGQKGFEYAIKKFSKRENLQKIIQLISSTV